MWNHKRLWMVTAILKNKNKARAITPPDFKLYSKSTVIKTVLYWHKNRHKDQWNIMESPKIHSSIYGELIFDKGANTQWRKGRPFNKWSCENWTTICKTMKLDPCFIPLTKINLKRIKELIIRHDSINSPRRKHREESSLTFVFAMIFFYIWAQSTVHKIEKQTNTITS